MRRRENLPSHRLRKPTGQAVMTLNGKDRYLGRHGTRESKDAYDRLTGEWLVAGRRLPARQGPEASAGAPEETDRETRTRSAATSAAPTINQLILAYWQHAQTVRSRFGLEAAQVVLGHAQADVTQIHAARDLAKAHAVMAEIG